MSCDHGSRRARAASQNVRKADRQNAGGRFLVDDGDSTEVGWMTDVIAFAAGITCGIIGAAFLVVFV